jgi:hypothetical protein
MGCDEPVGQSETADVGGGLLATLPVVYAVAIALHEAGVPLSAIADRLELPEESMPALLEIASAKLDTIREAAEADQPVGEQ